jgi:hypothetical protein
MFFTSQTSIWFKYTILLIIYHNCTQKCNLDVWYTTYSLYNVYKWVINYSYYLAYSKNKLHCLPN